MFLFYLPTFGVVSETKLYADYQAEVTKSVNSLKSYLFEVKDRLIYVGQVIEALGFSPELIAKLEVLPAYTPHQAVIYWKADADPCDIKTICETGVFTHLMLRTEHPYDKNFKNFYQEKMTKNTAIAHRHGLKVIAVSWCWPTWNLNGFTSETPYTTKYWRMMVKHVYSMKKLTGADFVGLDVEDYHRAKDENGKPLKEPTLVYTNAPLPLERAKLLVAQISQVAYDTGEVDYLCPSDGAGLNHFLDYCYPITNYTCDEHYFKAKYPNRVVYSHRGISWGLKPGDTSTGGYMLWTPQEAIEIIKSENTFTWLDHMKYNPMELIDAIRVANENY
jgi:hypothetical protein